ncbi:hypothetical protein LEP1GSC050_2196 [Leptospira broomii serovar Hurstbridge str. 5399]|uniref:Uncharacterized protein n=1 Tax=Leptospira broomii serovar Hurstbridge str. 5399 TaxID=1049789 RepID=T0F183_9LEPT|nr:hypothetical protein [Leptospira broomii]EQA44915.1 hypothetical protein LEP1GSC050_2196 [Leptospira broomii serovar Hurstbridge str. 5399]
MDSFAILGLGYTGLRAIRALELDLPVIGFSANTRTDTSKKVDFSQPEAIQKFKSEFESSPFEALIVTFPIHSLATRDLLLEVLPKVARRRWLLGTTSIYQRGGDILETTPKNSDHARYEIEERFLESGGKILRLCGIYGPKRNPGDWARKGLVKKNKRQLNLVHVDDITQVLRRILLDRKDTLPSELLLSDNQWHTWFEIFRFLEDNGKIDPRNEEESDREDAFVDSSLIRKFLPGLQTKDFWGELEKLEELP